MAASVFTQDGASTFAPSHGTGEDDSSDWDRFSDDGNETTSSTALSDGSGPASQVPLLDCEMCPALCDAGTDGLSAALSCCWRIACLIVSSIVRASVRSKG